jgi:hypothetical protein
MASMRSALQSIVLVALFILGGSVSTLVNSTTWDATDIVANPLISSTSAGESVQVQIASAGDTSSQLQLELPALEPLQELEMTITPTPLSRPSAFSWSDWNHPDATKSGMNIINGAMSSSGQLMIALADYDFNNGLNGWTTTGPGTHNTMACGMNGSSGGSLALHSSPMSFESPTHDLSAISEAYVAAWAVQGLFNCGEQPDNGENLRFEYQDAAKSWHELKMYTPGSSQNVKQMYKQLPADAFHSDLKIRARTNSASCSLCDYWYVDDIRILISGTSIWESPSFGYAANATESREIGPYASMFIDGTVPLGAALEWTVIDAWSGDELLGYVNRTGSLVDLSAVDWQNHEALRIKVLLTGNAAGESPEVYSITGGGRILDQFHTSPLLEGWTTNATGWPTPNWGGSLVITSADSDGDGVDDEEDQYPADSQRWHPIWHEQSLNLSGHKNQSITTPIFSPGVPIQGGSMTVFSDGDISAEISTDGEVWAPFNLSESYSFDNTGHRFQFRFTGTTRGWSISSLDIELVPAALPKSPTLDVALDGDIEWQFTDPAIGTWGWQDVFADGSKEVIISQTMSTSTKVPVWLPKDEVKHFQVSAIDHIGNGIDGLALWVGTQVVGEVYSDNQTLLSLSFNQSQLEQLAVELDFRPAVFDEWGQAYVYGEIEFIGSSGYYSMLGLGVGHHPISEIDVEALDPFVKSVNAARLGMGASGTHDIVLALQSQSRCQMRVDVDTITSDGSTMITRIDIANDSATLTPSYRWRELTTTIEVTSSAPGAIILDLKSDDNTSQWIIPLIGGNIITSGDDEVLIFADPAYSMVNNGVEYEITVRFRTAQSWDDQLNLIIDARFRLANGIVSMPARYEWGGTVLAIENDLIIKDITWRDDAGVMFSNQIYLRYDENISMDVEFGFENSAVEDAPFDNEYDLILTRGGNILANLSEIGTNSWTFTDTVPFVAGELEWNVTLTATAGGGSSDYTSVNRTFIIDSLSPKVTSTNIRHFDHRESSTQQLVTINVTDQPVLPTSLTLMVWREWVDDVNSDGQPGPGEYLPHGLTVPQSIDANYGFYTIRIDDSDGFTGMKVAGYVAGSDPSGLAIKSGGSDHIGQFLFMYQINIDGAPDVDDGTFSWQHGRSAWLHPSQEYTLDINFEEPNGVSDLDLIEVELASNIQSDPLLIIWSPIDNRCITTSNHLIITGCTIYSGSTVATAFDSDLTLSIDLSFSWSTPELGESRREPSVKIIDRAGAQDYLTYPESRWRFSPAMKVGENVELWVESGIIEQDSARVAPASNIELSGSVVFAESEEVPQFDCTARVNLDGNIVYASVEEGRFTATVNSPSATGSYPLTWAVGCLPAEGRDVTNQITSVYWIGVDASGPIPTQIDAPRPGSVLEAQTQLLQLEISDDFGIDTQSVQVIWWVTAIETGITITEGADDMTLIGTENSGQKVGFEGIIDLSGIDKELQYQKLQCHIRLVGRDLAGNEFQSDSTFNSDNKPFATWDIKHITPEFAIQSGGVDISKLSLAIDETVAVQIGVLNTGDRDGEVEVTLELVTLDGSRELIKREMLSVEANSLNHVVIDWRPTEPGIQWIEASIPNSDNTSSEWINVAGVKEDTYLDGVMGEANPILLGMSIFLIAILTILGLMWLRMATASKGGKGDDHLFEMVDADEYEDDDYDDYDED